MTRYPSPVLAAPTAAPSSPSAPSERGGQLAHIAPPPRPLFSQRLATASLATGAAETLDYTSAFRSLILRRPSPRWILWYVQAMGTSTGRGPVSLDQWRADGEELDHALSIRDGLVPLNTILPDNWSGLLTVRATNHSGATGVSYITLWLGPA